MFTDNNCNAVWVQEKNLVAVVHVKQNHHKPQFMYIVLVVKKYESDH